MPGPVTLVIHCFDPRAAEILQAVAEYFGDKVYSGEIITDKNGTRVGSTRTLFTATNAGGSGARVAQGTRPSAFNSALAASHSLKPCGQSLAARRKRRVASSLSPLVNESSPL